MAIIINPGTGPVSNAKESLAIEAAKQLARDLGALPPCGDDFPIPGYPARPDDPQVLNVDFRRVPERDADGYFGFVFTSGEYSATVDIPGLPLERLRWLKQPDQNIWNFQRLYINDSSFVWFYVVSIARRELTGTIERDE